MTETTAAAGDPNAAHELTDRIEAAVLTPNVSFELDRNLFGGNPIVRITTPGATPRAKRIQPVPVIVGDPGQTHADLLRQIADVWEQAARRRQSQDQGQPVPDEGTEP